MNDLKMLISNKDVIGIKQYMKEHSLVIKGNKIVPKDEITKINLNEQAGFWKQRQQAR